VFGGWREGRVGREDSKLGKEGKAGIRGVTRTHEYAHTHTHTLFFSRLRTLSRASRKAAMAMVSTTTANTLPPLLPSLSLSLTHTHTLSRASRKAAMAMVSTTTTSTLPRISIWMTRLVLTSLTSETRRLILPISALSPEAFKREKGRERGVRGRRR
jgi:hypothetical protein